MPRISTACRRLRKKAEKDRILAETLNSVKGRTRDNDNVSLHVQQFIEKMLKAYHLQIGQDYWPSHNLFNLVISADLDGSVSFLQLEPELDELTDYYRRRRYGVLETAAQSRNAVKTMRKVQKLFVSLGLLKTKGSVSSQVRVGS